MAPGRGHHWIFDAGDWKEKRVTPDLWEITYAASKRRAGQTSDHAPVPVGTECHWYILAHQTSVKGSADDYETKMTGLKFHLAQKRASKGKWSASGPTQRKHLIAFLKEFVAQLEKKPVPIEFEYRGRKFRGEGRRFPKHARRVSVTNWTSRSITRRLA